MAERKKAEKSLLKTERRAVRGVGQQQPNQKHLMLLAHTVARRCAGRRAARLGPTRRSNERGARSRTATVDRKYRTSSLWFVSVFNFLSLEPATPAAEKPANVSIDVVKQLKVQQMLLVGQLGQLKSLIKNPPDEAAKTLAEKQVGMLEQQLTQLSGQIAQLNAGRARALTPILPRPSKTASEDPMPSPRMVAATGWCFGVSASADGPRGRGTTALHGFVAGLLAHATAAQRPHSDAGGRRAVAEQEAKV